MHRCNRHDVMPKAYVRPCDSASLVTTTSLDYLFGYGLLAEREQTLLQTLFCLAPLIVSS